MIVNLEKDNGQWAGTRNGSPFISGINVWGSGRAGYYYITPVTKARHTEPYCSGFNCLTLADLKALSEALILFIYDEEHHDPVV